HTIKLPEIEKGAASATVREWLKSESQPIAKGEIIARLESEKCLIELESPIEGILQKILLAAGKTGAAGTPMAQIGEASSEFKVQSSEGQVPSSEFRVPSPGREVSGSTMDSQQKPQVQIQKETAMANIGSPEKVIPIVMPQAGQSMEEGTLLKWRVKEGDQIKQGQIIFEIETDKATMEVEADQSGRLAKIIVPEGETVPVKVPVALLADSDADAIAWLAAHQGETAQAETQPSAPPDQASASAHTAKSVHSVHPVHQEAAMTESGRVKASPAARKIAEEKGVDLQTVGAGSGPGGRIISTDVLTAELAPALSAASAARNAELGTRNSELGTRNSELGGAVRRKLSGMRKAIARNLVISKQTIPHFYTRVTMDARPMMDFYQERKAAFKCSLNDVIVAACARAIKEFPAFRSQLDGEEIVEFPTANIGIAVGMDEGLVVPVVVGADQMKFEQLAGETRRIVEAARGGKIEGRGKGIFTITNLGMFGVEEFSAIINPPEAAILAVSAIREAAIVKDGAMRAGRVMTMTLSCDHRIIDGLLAAKFLARLKEILENPTAVIS
ncbi:MAG: 2-oxo acid dehydrogenase subunit E2, partial [Candidatus Sumerlaeota bacterium]|nr:2-oxo acid dehydrogenase subunit E2 [Candidatus Sumerlaeota bacterium]